MKTFFKNNNSEEIILFFLGWGMDERPVLPLNSKKDIAYFYDYSDLKFNFDYSKYKKVYIISFSAGVSVAAYLNLPNIDYSVAINGTLNVCDKQYGLSNEIIKVFEHISMKNYIDFRRNYLVTNKEDLNKFNVNTPLRTLESSMKELEALKKYDFTNLNYQYNQVLISKDDKILPYEKQKLVWGNKLKLINGGHFALYQFKTLDEILEQ